MAQSPLNSDSPESVARDTRRSRRGAKRTKNARAIELVERIDGPHEALREKNAAVDEAVEAERDALDDWIADDKGQDDLLDSLSRKAEDYDADHPTAKTHSLLFRDKTPSEVRNLPRADEPDEVVKIIKRSEVLLEAHPGKVVITALQAAVEQTRTSERAYMAASTATAEARAAAEIAKLAVITAYRDNIIDVTRECGEQVAERCFPVLRKRGKSRAADPAKG